MSATILRGNALDLPLADASVDLIVTSPPYFGLRSYQDGGEHYDGQIGAEATPAEFVDALIAATAEMMRVLKPSGSIFVNLGDKYSGYNANGNAGRSLRGGERAQRLVQGGRGPDAYGVANKSLMNIPARYAIRCTDNLGLVLRAEIVWSKPNGLPESVTDRVRRSHETWFHFTKEPRYYSAVDRIREKSEQERPQTRRARELAARHGLGPEHRKALVARGLCDTGRGAAVQTGTGKNTPEVLRLAAEADAALGGYAREFTLSGESLGKLPGSVWTIPTQPLRVPPELGVEHFAAFPMEWPRRLIQGWCPEAVCSACGEGLRATTTAVRTARPTSGPLRGGANRTVRDGHPGTSGDAGNMMTLRTITGESCGCPVPTITVQLPWAPPVDNVRGVIPDEREGTLIDVEVPDPAWVRPPSSPGVVLDPFGGTGTTALVADVLGRDGISVDLSADYCRLAAWRTTDPRQRAAAMQVEPPPMVMPGSDSLLDLLDADEVMM